MATIAARPGSDLRIVPSLPGRRFDHAFFASMALLMLATVFAGFARTYYLAARFLGALPTVVRQFRTTRDYFCSSVRA